MHWRNRRQVRRCASGRTVAYNLRLPGQVFDGQAGLHQHYYEEFDRLARRRRSVTESEQVITEAAVLPAEIEQLPDLAGYVELASNPHVAPCELSLGRPSLIHALC
jgi:hypothetical protein